MVDSPIPARHSAQTSLTLTLWFCKYFGPFHPSSQVSPCEKVLISMLFVWVFFFFYLSWHHELLGVICAKRADGVHQFLTWAGLLSVLTELTVLGLKNLNNERPSTRLRIDSTGFNDGCRYFCRRVLRSRHWRPARQGYWAVDTRLGRGKRAPNGLRSELCLGGGGLWRISFSHHVRMGKDTIKHMYLCITAITVWKITNKQVKDLVLASLCSVIRFCTGAGEIDSQLLALPNRTHSNPFSFPAISVVNSFPVVNIGVTSFPVEEG